MLNAGATLYRMACRPKLIVRQPQTSRCVNRQHSNQPKSHLSLIQSSLALPWLAWVHKQLWRQARTLHPATPQTPSSPLRALPTWDPSRHHLTTIAMLETSALCPQYHHDGEAQSAVIARGNSPRLSKAKPRQHAVKPRLHPELSFKTAGR